MVEAPIGYKTPPFPSLYWPLGPHKLDFENSFLYNVKDIWTFTIIWTIILMCGFYLTAAGIAIFTHTLKRNNVLRLDDEEDDVDNESGDNLDNERIISHPKTQEYAGDSVEEADEEEDENYDNNGHDSQSTQNKAVIAIILTYLISGLVQSVVSGSLIAVLAAQVYSSANFAMSTWIPFTIGLIVFIFNLTTSFSLTSVVL